VTFQLNVTSCPAEAVDGFAVKLLIIGDGPVGTLLGV
jgi:hypothetical protein